MCGCGMSLLLVLTVFKVLGNTLCGTALTQMDQAVSGEVVWGIGQKLLERGPVICIDAGHGGKDNGSDYRKRMEKDDNLRLAREVAVYLKEKGVRVLLTREEDTFLSLKERCDFANEKQADYFVSLHRNSGTGTGVETWVNSEASERTIRMAEAIMEKLDGAGIQRNRGVRKGSYNSDSENYYVNAYLEMPSCIVEMGFIGDSTDNALFDKNLESYAAAIGEAILQTWQDDAKEEQNAKNSVTETAQDKNL